MKSGFSSEEARLLVAAGGLALVERSKHFLAMALPACEKGALSFPIHCGGKDGDDFDLLDHEDDSGEDSEKDGNKNGENINESEHKERIRNDGVINASHHLRHRHHRPSSSPLEQSLRQLRLMNRCWQKLGLGFRCMVVVPVTLLDLKNVHASAMVSSSSSSSSNSGGSFGGGSLGEGGDAAGAGSTTTGPSSSSSSLSLFNNLTSSMSFGVSQGLNRLVEV
jgi:hypothetical protein